METAQLRVRQTVRQEMQNPFSFPPLPQRRSRRTLVAGNTKWQCTTTVPRRSLGERLRFFGCRPRPPDQRSLGRPRCLGAQGPEGPGPVLHPVPHVVEEPVHLGRPRTAVGVAEHGLERTKVWVKTRDFPGRSSELGTFGIF